MKSHNESTGAYYLRETVAELLEALEAILALEPDEDGDIILPTGKVDPDYSEDDWPACSEVTAARAAIAKAKADA